MPLSGIRVVEFTHMVAGPACGQVLADFGAEVIKIEPAKGDITRSLGPSVGRDSALFASTNRGKKSVTLDIRDAEAAQLARRLVADADVLICNIDAGALDKAGLGYAVMSAANKGLIWVDVTAFGPGGALGTDGIAQAAMGLMSLTGAADGQSYRTGPSIVDVSTGVWAALGVMAALADRARTGLGDRIGASLADTCLYMQYGQVALAAADPASVYRNGNHSMLSCTPIFTASDGRVMTTILHDRHWTIICDLLDRPDLRDAPELATNALRCERQDEIEERLNPLFSHHPRAHWIKLLREHRIPCGPERDYSEILADPDLWKNGTLYTLPARDGQSVQVAQPVRFARRPPATPAPPPDLGADTEAVLASLRPDTEQR